MTSPVRKNIASSVHNRLLKKARESNRPFNELFQHYAIERFLYRLSKSSCADKFILKGALMLMVSMIALMEPVFFAVMRPLQNAQKEVSDDPFN